RQHPATGEALPLDDLRQVMGEPEVVVLELVVGAVVLAHAPKGHPERCGSPVRLLSLVQEGRRAGSSRRPDGQTPCLTGETSPTKHQIHRPAGETDTAANQP